MEDVAFNEWPGQPVDLNTGGANYWLPAYGFQTPHTLIERDDFLGSPDAEYFLNGNVSTPCLYLETIHEETSDDLRSDSDVRNSPSPTSSSEDCSDSEDSVICNGNNNEESESEESDREIACPVKRRRQDFNTKFLSIINNDEDYQSLSRSSSLLQFENLEKQCQETTSSTGSQYSVDSLETTNNKNHSSSSSDTLAPSKSCNSLLRIARSHDSLTTTPHKTNNKKSAENLSEDSGYSDYCHMYGGGQKINKRNTRSFEAYDYRDVSNGKSGGNFGASCQNLTLLTTTTDHWTKRQSVNIEKPLKEFRPSRRSKNTNPTSISEPNLHTSSSIAATTCTSSLPKNLNIIFDDKTTIATKNWDLSEMSTYKREGSYAEAMSNRVDLSDDEQSLCYKKPKTPIIEFDKRVLSAISESLHSLNSSITDAYLNNLYGSSRGDSLVAASTPNLAVNNAERKSSLVTHSTSTSCVSDFDDSSKILESSVSSKGVHFSPVVAELKWQRESTSSVDSSGSTYSIPSSSPDRDSVTTLTRKLLKRSVTPPCRNLGGSQPELAQAKQHTKNQLRRNFSSQPDVSRLKRWGSQLLKKDGDGCVIKAYVDEDGIQYRHTHLDLDDVYGVPSTEGGHVTKEVTKRAAGSETVAMEASRKQPTTNKTRKLGGFFSRLASFRFSNRNKDDKKKGKNVQASQPSFIPQSHQRVANKEDYIYIPLKGPSAKTTDNNSHHNNNNNNSSTNNVVARKPPLPRAPPRVVGASVKQTSSGGGVATHQRHQRQEEEFRKRTIDSCLVHRPMEPMGLIETDLDTEVTVITSTANNNNNNNGGGVKTRSLLDLGTSGASNSRKEQRLLLSSETKAGGEGHNRQRPHKSMEFLLDKQNLKVVEPPENELQKGGGDQRVMSEHELRVQRSLQKLNVPDWYKQSAVPREGFLLKNKPTRESRWTGTSNKTTSLSSLGSPIVISPNNSQQQPFIRWSTSKLNSTASSPCASVRSSFNAARNGSVSPASSVRSSFSYRQPYMGWRSQERLNNPRTPHERLTNSLLCQKESPEIQSSIKEVTSAIVHYVSGLKPSEDSYSGSPRGSNQKLCWLESSFVGIKPLDSPQTPMGLNEGGASAAAPSTGLRLELQTHNDVRRHSLSMKHSPGSTTLEDVLDSLLGLPPSERAASPSLQGTESPVNIHRRRSSEGSNNSSSRRVSIQSSPVLQCRYSKCSKMVKASSDQAQSFKNCHNCSYTYCSRTCRRAHWEKHRKTCLFSRIGTLSKDVISAVKQNTNSLYHLSVIARRGYLSHGSGAVKCFFGNPETAERFLNMGHAYLGELTYVRWQDLLPSEMGTQLYTELVQMCKTYNPDTKLILYVSICVVSEAPSNRWERQLVSRCAKLKLSKEIYIADRENTETLLLFTPNSEQTREDKEMCLSRIEKELKSRGVFLRKQHPVIFKQLRAYADGMCDEDKMAPITVYPKDTNSGNSFMCIIMLDTDMDSLRQVENAGVRVRTVNLLADT